jgi:hypothetical protein
MATVGYGTPRNSQLAPKPHRAHGQLLQLRARPGRPDHVDHRLGASHLRHHVVYHLAMLDLRAEHDQL